MLAPLSWLKEYVDIDVTPKELEEKLFSCGFEVEELIEVGKDISNVVVGLVEECEPIPETHLSLCKVNAGAHGTFQICCGADNVKAGGKFPLALIGATVYATAKDHVTIEGVMEIKQGKLRGYDSFGMLCSGVEIGLNEDLYPGAGYNGLLELPADAEVGADIKPIVGLDDWIFDIAITANRPDCQSIFGIAREVAAVLGKELKEPALDFTPTEVKKDGFAVTVEAQDICPRYIAHYVHDVVVKESPAWMRRRLALVGIASISNIVDITNYVLKELGQPMHAFDYNYLEGNKINVRRADNGEKIVTLDEKEFELTNSNLVICDGAKPVALAGIMGGLNSEILDTTTEVMFEAAKFARDNIRKSSRALGQSSDSSALFSKGLNEYTTVMAMNRALHLIEELECGKVSSTHEEVCTGNSIEPTEMKASIKKVNGVLGIEVPNADIERILTALNFQPTINGDELTIMVPGYREDMESYPDIAEEVIRMYGYEHVVSTFMPTAKVTLGGLNLRQKTELKIKKALCAAGAYEGMHYSFFSPSDFDLLRLPEDAPERKAIKLINPINIDLSLMRTTLVPQMIYAMQRNQKKGILEGRIFELGNKFIPKSLPLTEYPDERETICVGVFGENESFFTLKGLAETVADALCVEFTYEASTKTFLHPYQTATILCEGEAVGFLGQVTYEIQDELDMRVPAYVMEIDLKSLTKYYGKEQVFTPIPKFAEEKRDFAFVVDKEITCAQIENGIKEACDYVTAVKLFDVYEGSQLPENMKSMAFNVVFTPRDEELKAKKVEGFVENILANLKDKLGITLRV
ncbi:MAG: phenylalanine--tRNA ligase subunit beta [Agathobacter sp.]|nr:phenylalanine--tRNA ligase subunit beta [Agathobacter sp.]